MRIGLAGFTAGAVALMMSTPGSADPAGPPTEQLADVCLEVASGSLSTQDWAEVTTAVDEAVAARSALFPSPQLDQEPTRLDIDSGHLRRERGYGPCLQPGAEWTARFGREFLEAGADQMLAEAPTTPGIASDVVIDWYPSETRMRTLLAFAGPLDIPNGTCWIDDALSVDVATGSVVASGEQGVKTSLFAEGACDRFFDHLPDGGAGQQAVTLLPRTVMLSDGSELRFVAEGVSVTEDSVLTWGRLEQS